MARPWGIREPSSRSPAPPPDFLWWPLIPTSAEALTASAPPLESPLLLGRGPGAATSWRLPLKRPGLGEMHSDAGQAAEGKGGERTRGEGASDGAPPLLSAAHCRPRPFLADSPSSPRGSLGLDTASRAGSISALFPEFPSSAGFWSPKSWEFGDA